MGTMRSVRPRELTSSSSLFESSPRDDDFYDDVDESYHHVHHSSNNNDTGDTTIDFDSPPYHHRHTHNRRQHYSASYSPQNHTITTSVSIRVTPLHDYFYSWSILWACCLVATVWATWQVAQEYRSLRQASPRRRRPRALSSAVSASAMTTVTANNNNHSTNTTNNMGGVGYLIVEVKHPPVSDESISTADITRCMIRRLFLLALLSRVIAIPVEIFIDPMWWQFVGDTLPEMVFASAWTLLVTFFVQLVGVATGTGTHTSPGLVITLTAYAVYVALILLQLHNKVASVLLYALLCCIYATLLGVVLYFCPILLSLLWSSTTNTSTVDGADISGTNGLSTMNRIGRLPNRRLTTRLSLATAICIFVFAAHTVRYARLVVAPPDKVYWWYQYGVLELIPTVIFLILMRPNRSRMDRNLDSANSPMSSDRRSLSHSGIRRVDSDVRRIDDTALLSSSMTSVVGNSSRRDHPPWAKEKGTPSEPGYGSIPSSTDAGV